MLEIFQVTLIEGEGIVAIEGLPRKAQLCSAAEIGVLVKLSNLAMFSADDIFSEIGLYIFRELFLKLRCA